MQLPEPPLLARVCVSFCFFSSRRRHTRCSRDWSSDVCSSDLCPDNCTHAESQDIALVPAKKAGRVGFNVLVGGKMGSGGFTVASPLNVFVEAFQAVPVVVELIKIYRDHGPREARSKCRFAFLIEEWGLSRLRTELIERLGHELAFQGRDMRSSSHADHLGVTRQRQEGLRAVGLCVPTGRVNPEQLDELARLAAIYGNGEIRLTTAQNAIIPHIPADAVGGLLAEPLLKQFSPRPSPFLRNMVACVGTGYCNLALIETKRDRKSTRLNSSHGYISYA